MRAISPLCNQRASILRAACGQSNSVQPFHPERSLSLGFEVFAGRRRACRRALSLWGLIGALWLFAPQHTIAQQDIPPRVVKLQHSGIGRHGLETRFASGWCVDAGCSLLATNYHVAKGGLPRKIGRAKVLKVRLATGPDDYEAVWISTTYGKWLRFNPLNDVALVFLSQPLLPGTPPASFYSGDLLPGQELEITGFPSVGTRKRIEVKFLRMIGGLIEFSLPIDRPAGLSGSVVTDRQGRVVGMLSSVGDGFALAVPLWSIAEAIHKLRPALYAELFPGGPTKPPEFQDSMALTPELSSSPKPVLPLASLEDGLGRPFPNLAAHAVRLASTREEPVKILELRRHAQHMFQQMANFRALQTLRMNTEGKSELTWLHEIYVDSNNLVFRAVDSGQLTSAVALPHWRRAVVPGGEWRHLPQMLATEFKLRVEEVGTRDVGGKRVLVFRYQASAEDQVCWVRFRNTEVFWSRDHQFPVACRGDVWTDSELNVLRISQELEIRERNVPMDLFQLAVLYGWLGDDLVPVDMVVRGLVARHECRTDAHFSNYKRIESR